MYTKRIFMPLAAVALVAATSAAVWAQSDAPALLSRVGLPAEHLEVSPANSRYDSVQVDFGLLDALGVGSKLRFNLFDDADYTGTVTQIERRGERRYSIFGTLDGVEHGQFHVAVHIDAVAAFIDAGVRNQQFRIRYAGGDDVYYVWQIDQNQYRPCGDPDAKDPTGEKIRNGLHADEMPAEDDDDGGSYRDEQACSQPGPIWDMGVIFTTKTKNALGGTNNTVAEIQAAIDGANQGYANSNVDGRMRLIYTGETDYDENGTYEQHRDRLADTNDGYFDWIHDRRNSYGLDMMSIWVTGGTDSWCGMAYCQADASTSFMACNYDCAVSNYTYQHEHGHNQGCAHNKDDAGSCPLYSYSYGWRWHGNNGYWRSVMAYDTDPSKYTRVNYFSNPGVKYDGVNTGVTDDADNHRTLNNTDRTAEAWRASVYDVWVDWAYASTEKGTFSQPFNTVAEGVAKIHDGANPYEIPVLHIKTGTRKEVLTIDKHMFITPCGGSVIIGKN